ncbi:MAG: response regulator [Elusimicrobia bacterium]|nr:response regulator [Elusimicrobiota bacterium]
MEKEKSIILVVDDDKKIVELIRVNLEGAGYEIDIAYDGEQALEKVWNKGSQRPDLIILDLMLPKLNGYEVAKQIKSKKQISDIPIIMLTAKNQPLDKMEGLLGSEVDYYLTKPIDINDLLIHVMKALSKQSSHTD